MLTQTFPELDFSEAQERQLISGRLTQATVPALTKKIVKKLLQLPSGQSALTLDLSKLTHVDTAGLAWLLYVIEQAHKANVAVTLSELPEDLINLTRLTGVDDLLPLA
ncbi:STAS domain-containing protein [Endozoicomonas sp. G2_1]|uniref:STAS domain-containing protein n=1 Tax=Endozoicomonas sp. G2_1 TaxID=2821091 RepID=UPI001ADC7BB9|nr:STAS domain-containing protein [Endozoicomonas sp. G2_1]MBO9489585.1 STAS domain-containing protein [Endozoicomonas sp. G2_1]